MLGIADLSRVLFPDEQEKTTIRRKSQDRKSDRITCNTSTSTSTSVFDQLNQFKLNHSGPSRNCAFDESGISPMIISPPKFRRNQKDDCRNKTDIVDSSDYKLESLDSLASLSIKDDIDVRKFDLPAKVVRELGKPPHGSSSLFPMAEKVSRLCSTSSKMLHQSSSTKRHNNEHQMLDATEIGGVLGTFCNSGPTSKLVKCRGDAEEQGRTRKNNTTLVDVTNSAHSTQSKMKIGRNRDGSCESMFVSTIGRGKCDDQVKANFKIDQTKKPHNSLTKTTIDKRTLLSPSYQSDTLMELISPVTTQRPSKRISKKKTPYRVSDASTTTDHNTKNLQCLEEKRQSESSDQDDVCINNDIKTTNKSLSFDITNEIKWQKYNDYKKYEGARLAKRFSRKTYLGTVYESFLDNENTEIYFGVHYDDGDEEDLSYDELLKCISLYQIVHRSDNDEIQKSKRLPKPNDKQSPMCRAASMEKTSRILNKSKLKFKPDGLSISSKNVKYNEKCQFTNKPKVNEMINCRRSSRVPIPTDRLTITDHSNMYLRESYMDKVFNSKNSPPPDDNDGGECPGKSSDLSNTYNNSESANQRNTGKDLTECKEPDRYSNKKVLGSSPSKKHDLSSNSKKVALQSSETNGHPIRRSARVPIPTDRLTITDHSKMYLRESYMDKVCVEKQTDELSSSSSFDNSCDGNNRIDLTLPPDGSQRNKLLGKNKPSTHAKRVNISKAKLPSKKKNVPKTSGEDKNSSSENNKMSRRSSRASIPTDRLTITDHSKSYLLENYRNENHDGNFDDVSCSSVDNVCDENSLNNEKSSIKTQHEEDDFFADDETIDIKTKDTSALKQSDIQNFIINEVRQRKVALSLDADEFWTKEQLNCLKGAYCTAKPTSNTFWEDIAASVDEKSAFECRDKWFSLVNTTDESLVPSKTSCHTNNSTRHHTENHEDDDIFRSTPFRLGSGSVASVLPSSQRKGNIGDLRNLSFEFDAIISSPILNGQQNARRTSGGFSPLKTPPTLLKAGYKGYIMKFVRGRRGVTALPQRTKKGKKKATKKPASHYVSVDKGDVHMNAMISPGGTVRVVVPTDSDLEDIILDSEDDDESDDEKSEVTNSS